jgi:agmatine deiminase
VDAAAASAAGDPLPALNRLALESAAAVLTSATNQDGARLRLVRVPEPGTIATTLTPDDGSYKFIADLNAHPLKRLRGAQTFVAQRPVKLALAASYMNFVVANNLVLVPEFYKAGRSLDLRAKDDAFKRIIEQCYPHRKVVQIDVDSLTVGGGGMHCITQHLYS